MGFSLLGLIVSIAVLAPNLLLLWFPPHGQNTVARVPRLLEGVERMGQALCLVVPAITLPGAIVWWWALPAVLALAIYYGLWGRYLVAGRAQALLYASLWRVPVPMAVMPVVVFLCAAAWLSNPWIAIAAAVLALGHIPVALLTRRAIRSAPSE
ncbi:hypothetical protein [Microbacterium saperdae]|uniref:Uncharacterized protein n=1 Tax=Microbacterium saperdae TaxID=69368 RepID=A0A543B9P1_9MICO|nr:hypothetical protein [Microbacterium saperdae]TQL81564.1 hypothetical protein FB560_3037 [Microbacterium saperdae]GGM59339.1 hypothetical protein GCM10010489_33690 [Microbacterium saperdae]